MTGGFGDVFYICRDGNNSHIKWPSSHIERFNLGNPTLSARLTKVNTKKSIFSIFFFRSVHANVVPVPQCRKFDSNSVCCNGLFPVNFGLSPGRVLDL